MQDAADRVPVAPEVEKELRKHGFTKMVWNGVINEWSKSLHHRPGKQTSFALKVRFGEWRDVKGGMTYLYMGNSFGALPHVKTLDQILEVIKVMTIPTKKAKKEEAPKVVLDKIIKELKQNRNILEEDDYPKSHQDGWHYWGYWESRNTDDNYQIRLTKLWDMSGRDHDKAKAKASQLDQAIVNFAKHHGVEIEIVKSEVTMNDPDRAMYNAHLKLV